MRLAPITRIALALVAFGLFTLALWPVHEPEYRGKRLREWLMDCTYRTPQDEPSHGGAASDMRFQLSGEASDAVRHMGTNALPYLLKWLKHEPPESESARARISSVLTKWGLCVGDVREPRARCAVDAFRALGPAARASIPELLRTMTETNRGRSAARAAYAMGLIGDAALPPLLTLLTNDQPRRVKILACESIGLMATNGSDAAPFLADYLARTNSPIAFNVAWALLRLRAEPHIALRGFVHCLKHGNNPQLRLMGAQIIGNFGEKGRAALPDLIQALTDPEPEVRAAATNAIRRIDPVTLNEKR